LDVKEVFRLRSPGILPALLIVLLSVPAFFTASMLNTILVYLLQFIGDMPITPIPAPGNLKELAIGILVICVSPALCEELLHRGIMLSGYERRGSLRAVAMTAFMFGIFHFDISNFLGPVLLGLFIGYYVVRTNSIFAGMLAHFANNAISELIQYFFPSQAPQQQYLRVSAQELGGSIFWGIAGLAVCVALLLLFKLSTEKRSVLRPPVSSRGKDMISLISHWPIICIITVYFFLTLLTILSSVLIKLSNG
jgi:membrane protease YdiL (CAAX protease family)